MKHPWFVMAILAGQVIKIIAIVIRHRRMRRAQPQLIAKAFD